MKLPPYDIRQKPAARFRHECHYPGKQAGLPTGGNEADGCSQSLQCWQPIVVGKLRACFLDLLRIEINQLWILFEGALNTAVAIREFDANATAFFEAIRDSRSIRSKYARRLYAVEAMQHRTHTEAEVQRSRSTHKAERTEKRATSSCTVRGIAVVGLCFCVGLMLLANGSEMKYSL